MTVEQAKRLKLRTRIKWNASGEKGTVVVKDRSGIGVQWADEAEDVQVRVYLFDNPTSLSCMSEVR